MHFRQMDWLVKENMLLAQFLLMLAKLIYMSNNMLIREEHTKLEYITQPYTNTQNCLLVE